MKVLVCGSRHFKDFTLMNSVLSELGPEYFTLIEGGARGADFLAKQWAYLHGMGVEEYPADWEEYGKAAGPIRNKQMLVEGKPDLVIAFLASNSRGTKNMIAQAEKAEIPVKIVEITNGN